MKKITLFILLGLFSFSLVGCGDTTNTNNGTTDDNKQETLNILQEYLNELETLKNQEVKDLTTKSTTETYTTEKASYETPKFGTEFLNKSIKDSSSYVYNHVSNLVTHFDTSCNTYKKEVACETENSTTHYMINIITNNDTTTINYYEYGEDAFTQDSTYATVKQVTLSRDSKNNLEFKYVEEKLTKDSDNTTHKTYMEKTYTEDLYKSVEYKEAELFFLTTYDFTSEEFVDYKTSTNMNTMFKTYVKEKDLFYDLSFTYETDYDVKSLTVSYGDYTNPELTQMITNPNADSSFESIEISLDNVDNWSEIKSEMNGFTGTHTVTLSNNESKTIPLSTSYIDSKLALSITLFMSSENQQEKLSLESYGLSYTKYSYETITNQSTTILDNYTNVLSQYKLGSNIDNLTTSGTVTEYTENQQDVATLTELIQKVN